MSEKLAAMAEAYRRGILPEDKKPLFEEAMRRGLVARPEMSNQPQEPAPVGEQSSFLDAAARVPGRTLRAGVGGVTNIADLIAAPARSFLNWANEKLGGAPDYFKPLGKQAEQVFDDLGVAKAANDHERLFDAGAEAVAEAITTMGTGKAIQAVTELPSYLSKFGSFLTEAPRNQALSSAAGGMSVEGARQAGAGAGGQVAAGMAGGVVAPSIPAMVNNFKANIGKSLVSREKANLFREIGEQAPSLGAVSDSGLVQATEGALGSLFPSAGVMKKAGQRGQEILERQVDRVVDELSGGAAVPRSLEEAGEAAATAAQRSKDSFSSRAANFENTVYRNLEQYPAELRNVLELIESNAQRLSPEVANAYRQRMYNELGPVLKDATPQMTIQGQPVTETMLAEAPFLRGKVEYSEPALNVASLRDFRRGVGERMKGPPTATTGDVTSFERGRLYGALKKDIEGALPTADRAKVDQYNKWYGQEKNLRDAVESDFFGKKTATQTAKAILGADKKQLDRLRQVLGDNAFNQLQASALLEAVKGNAENVSAAYIASRLGNGRQAMQPGTKNALFGGKEQNLTKLAKSLNESKAYLNQSKTANASMLGQLWQGAALGAGTLTSIPATAATMLGLNLAARGMTSPRVINALSRWRDRGYRSGAGANLPAAMPGLLALIDDQPPKKDKKRR